MDISVMWSLNCSDFRIQKEASLEFSTYVVHRKDCSAGSATPLDREFRLDVVE
jgi:hypothetical protein